ncbi:TetR/AcrR family transcriptional regulator [Insolitispirillum peregrinum]|uniref:Transcriptional regulator, TetR family n=1 Tax=Insolitispirillum peregrinum TaxID=80876 RepID=A0A1N7PVC6_9PROT|nr:TetR/AcrR family transcriptional regulator [Insolitispirillum peregrinum]SIT14574.1 transcriptional regulator, TetR family [Insolitispirillum peregrinum]
MTRKALSGRESNKANIQSRVVQCALQLFREKGVDATTMETVAEVAGITKRTLYRYFPKKEAIADAYWQENVREKVAMLPELLQAYPDTRARLMAIFLDASAGLRADPEIARMHFSYQFQQLGRELEGKAGLANDFTAFLTAVIYKGQTSGDVRPDIPAEQLAWQVQLLFAGICLTWFANPDVYALEARLTEAIACFMDGAGIAH